MAGDAEGGIRLPPDGRFPSPPDGSLAASAPHGRYAAGPAAPHPDGNWPAVSPPPAPEAPDAPAESSMATWFRIILAIDLLLFGLVALSQVVLAAIVALDPGGELARQTAASGRGLTPQALLANALVTVAIGGIIPLMCIAGSRRQPWRGTLAFFGLRQPGRGAALGLGWGILLLILTYIALAAYVAIGAALAGEDMETFAGRSASPLSEGIAAAIDPVLLVVVAACAAVGEEVLFRGLLQRRLGLWGQAVAFGLVHASYGTPVQLAFPFLVGLLFGHLYRKTGNLWVPITAHFVFDAVQLALALALRPTAEPAATVLRAAA